MFTSALRNLQSNITTNYTIAPHPTSTSGVWKIFDGKKKGSGKLVSVFIFDRKSLGVASDGFGGRGAAASQKKLQDEVFARIKKECSMLTRLRHPCVLELAEPIEDTRNGLMFATEAVTASLATLLEEKDLEDRRGASGSNCFAVDVDELEIQKGLLQVAQGLEFLHESAQLVHGNLTPEAIFVNSKSDWKIAGLGFAGPPENATSQNQIPSISLSEVLYHEPRLPSSVQLNLDYTSPDFAMDGNITTSADMFSLGLLILALYNAPHTSPLKTNQNLSTYKKLLSSSSSVPSASNRFLCNKSLPQTLTSAVLPRLITRRPAQRMNVREFQQSEFFDNILVSSIRFLESLPTKSANEKNQFMRGLPRILDQFPKSVLEKKVLTALLDETKDKELLYLILQNTFKIIKILPASQKAFTTIVVPSLRDVFLSGQGKAASSERDSAKEAALVVILENMSLIGENCNGKEFKDDILPIIQLGLESPTHSIVDKSLGSLETVLSVLDFSTIKNEVFPLVAAVFSKTSSLGIKIRGLEAFVVLCGGKKAGDDDLNDGLDGSISMPHNSKSGSTAILDKYTVQEKVVPLIRAIKTKEPAVTIAALAVFKQVAKMADAEFLAMEVLPILWSFSLGPLLNLDQFQQYMALIKSISTKIENEQTRKLRDLSSSQVTTSGSLDASRSNTFANGFSQVNGSNDVGEDDFQRLVLGKGGSGNNDMLGDGWRSQPQRAQDKKQETPMFSWSTSTLSPSQNQGQPIASLSTLYSSNSNTHSRAITPDHTMSSFASLSPAPKVGSTMTMGAGGFNALTPMQPSSTGGNSSTLTNTASSTIPNSKPYFQPQPVSNIRPPMQPSNSAFSTFSIAPPPINPARPQIPMSMNGSFSKSTAPPASSQAAPKKGLDAYQSLI